MRPLLAMFGLFLLAGCQAAPAEMTEAAKADLIASATQAATAMMAAFDAEDSAAYFSNYSDWADYPASGYPQLTEMPSRLQASWWDRYEDRTTRVGEMKGRVLGPEAVALERIDTSTVTDSDGTRLEQSWVGRQLWVRENGAWRILFEGFQMLGSNPIQ